VSSCPHSRCNSIPGMNAGATAATLSSLTNTEVPSAFTPVTTRLMDLDASLVDLAADLASAAEAVDLTSWGVTPGQSVGSLNALHQESRAGTRSTRISSRG